MRHFLVCAAAVVFGLLIYAGPRQAAAQQDMFYFTQQIETGFADVETRRLAGDCPARDKRLGELREYLRPMIAPNAQSFNAAIREEYRIRLEEAAARPCPPRATRPAPPPKPAAVPAPLPRTVTLDDLRLQLAEACGAAFEPARERLIAAFDRAIRLEPNPRQKRYLELNRAAVQQVKAPRCPTAAEAAAPASATRFFAMRRFYNHANALSDHLQKAETARWAGDCARRAIAMDAAWAAWAAMQETGYRPSTPRQEDALLRDHEKRPCPDPLSKASPPPPAPVPAPTPSTAARPTTPPLAAPPASASAAPVCPADYKTLLSERRSTTCRCSGKQQYLSVWGANPYRQISAICNAAIHAGVLPPSGVGTVRLVPAARAQAALGTARNGISASNWDYDFQNAFSFAASQPGTAEPAREPDGRYMLGNFDTTYGPMFLVNGRGSYEDSGGTITPTRIDGSILEAVWEQTTSSRRCADGRYRGRLRFVFTETGFVGTWAYCDDPLGGSWSGTRREAAR